MKASELIASLQALIDIYGDLDLIYAKDDEGNAFYKIHATQASACHFYNDRSDEASFDGSLSVNAFCVN